MSINMMTAPNLLSSLLNELCNSTFKRIPPIIFIDRTVKTVHNNTAGDTI